jgi:hypothetical protein
MWCHYCDKNNHNTADCRAIAIFKQQKNNKAHSEAKAGPGKKSLAFLFLFEEINALKRKLKPEKTASSKKRKTESILSTEINLTTSSDEGEEYLFTSSKPFSSSKIKLENHLTQKPITELEVSLIINNQEHLLRALADTGASSSIILEAYTSASFIKTDDSNTTTWSTISGIFITTKTGIGL